MTADPDDPKRSLVHHVEVLYALALVLVGSDDAPSLLRRVYEEAAAVPPTQRPSDERAWLFRLMTEAQNTDLHSAGAEVHPGSDTSFTDDPFRREVAEQTADRMLPVALAACSIHERFILSIDVLGDPSDELLAAALDTSTTNARSIRDRARSALRASLRDVLKGPERMLVDVALPDEALRGLLRELLLDRFHPPPPSLQTSIAEITERAQAKRASRSDSTNDSSILPPAFSLPSGFSEALHGLRQWVSFRGLIGGVVFLTVVTAGLGGAAYLFSSSSSPEASPPSSVVELSVQRAEDVSVAHETQSPSEAAAFIRQTWNRRVSVPTIEDASLRGVGRLSLPPTVEVPALLYATADGSDLVALTLNYALLNRLGDQATLPRNRRAQLSTNDSLLTEERSDRAVVLWRQRDDIFVLIAPNADADALRSRIQL